MKTLFIVTAFLLTGCSSLPTQPLQAQPSPLVLSSCVAQAPLIEKTFAAYIEKLNELATAYRVCCVVSTGSVAHCSWQPEQLEP